MNQQAYSSTKAFSTSFVYSNAPMVPQKKFVVSQDSAASRPFIPYQTDEQVINQSKQSDRVRDVDSEKLKMLHNLQNKLPPHQFHFFSYILACHKIDNELETIQQSLLNDTNFSVSKLFTFFDVNGDRSIQFSDFMITMQKLDIILKREELYNLFNRLGGDDDNIICYAEFQELFNPKKQKRSHFWNKDKNTLQSKVIQDSCLITEQQQKLLHDMFNLYMSVERSLNALIKEIGQKDTLLEIFKGLDQESKGYLQLHDIHNYVMNLGGQFNRVFYNLIQIFKTDFTRLFHRIQKHKSGRVNFEEFLNEFGSKEAIEQDRQSQQSLIKSHTQPAYKEQDIVIEPPIKQQPEFVLNPPRQADFFSNPSLSNSMYVQPKPARTYEIEENPPMQGFSRYVFQKQGQ